MSMLVTPVVRQAPVLVASIPVLETQKKSMRLKTLTHYFSAAPWWGVSLVLHGLVIALAGLISIAFKVPQVEAQSNLTTAIELRPSVREAEDAEFRTPKMQYALLGKTVTPLTDATAKELGDVSIPPEFLAKAELGDPKESVDFDTFDTANTSGLIDDKRPRLKNNTEEKGVTPQGDALIGIGGELSKGAVGGNWGRGKGRGNGSGAGKDELPIYFANRTEAGRKLMVEKHGGNAATENAVEHALAWLARNQNADGSWEHDRKREIVKDRRLFEMYDTAITGLAILSFLGAGHSEKAGKYKENVKKGVSYLIKKLKAVPDKLNGSRWGDKDYANNYVSGIACLALGEAAGMSRIKETMEAVQLAANGVDDAQIQVSGSSDREAWDYGPRDSYEKLGYQTMENDSSIMSWNILALKSCKAAGLKVNPACFEGCLRWINAGQDLDGFNVGDYNFVGGRMPYRGTVAKPNKGTFRARFMATAAAGYCRILIGGETLNHPGVLGPCNEILQYKPQTYDVMDFYSFYYETLLMFQKGGEHWKVWNTTLKGPLVDGQVKVGVDAGSWEWNNQNNKGGCVDRVMATALACLCMEVYYRYPLVHPNEK